ncbi:MAG: Ig-like domain-containing protein [Clostridia bacterium]|nr:Ig-like domain-containing protein [Clostridia bacterium]
MKKTGKIICIILVAILIVVMIISNNTNGATAQLSATQTSVESGNTFDVTFKLNDAQASIMTFYVNYDKEKFEYVSCLTSNQYLVSNKYQDGTIAVFYNSMDFTTGTDNSAIDSVAFRFKAKNAGKGTIEIENNNDFGIVLADKNNTNLSYSSIESGSKLSANIEVTEKQVEEKPDPELSESEISLKIGETKDISITNGVEVTWSSDNTSVATVENGKITAIAEGTAIITATGNEKTATVKVTVKNNIQEEAPAPILSESEIPLKIGETKDISVTNGVEVTWSSDNTSVATVENGKITAIAEGTANIIATGNEKTATAKVTVTNNDIIEEIISPKLSENEVKLNIGQSQQITVTNGVEVTWSSDNTSVATVENGKITAIAEGIATITAKDANGNLATVSVTVSKLASNDGIDDGNNNNGNAGSNNTGNATGNTGSNANKQNSINTNITQSNGAQSNTGNSSSSANEATPQAGENTADTLIILAIITLIVASVIFRKKSRIR